ncbi:permease [Candidatus Woesearchaeota archaeon]|nr:permease [Candidatus Woesearchaeota archaeon]MBW2994536.1 permease [Candidatus Woesearchaeota archaeon]
MRKSETSRAGWWFLLVVILVYLLVGLIKPAVIFPSLIFLGGIFLKIWWVFLFVFVLLSFLNYYVQPKHVYKYLGKSSGAKGWMMAIVGGIISTGPIYVWYPLLNELQKHGTRNGLIVAFLYTRAIKPALLPLLIFYFGLTYTVVLTIVMIVLSVIQGIIVEKLIEVEK